MVVGRLRRLGESVTGKREQQDLIGGRDRGRDGETGYYEDSQRVRSVLMSLVGGMAFDYGGLLLPFQIAFWLLVFTTIFASIFLPYIDPSPPLRKSSSSSSISSTLNSEPDGNKDDTHGSTDSRSLLYPLKLFVPRLITLPNGARGRDWNLTLLGMGAFVSVLATGYVGMGLQLVATNVFGFKPGPSGLMLVSLYHPTRI